MSVYTVSPWTPKNVDEELLNTQLLAAGIPSLGVECDRVATGDQVRALRVHVTGVPNEAAIKGVTTPHVGNYMARIRQSETDGNQNLTVLRSPQMTTLITNLKAGTVSAANQQKAIAFILDSMRRAAGSIS